MGESGGIAPPFLTSALDVRERPGRCCLTPGRNSSQYPLYRRLAEPRSWSRCYGDHKNLLPQPRFLGSQHELWSWEKEASIITGPWFHYAPVPGSWKWRKKEIASISVSQPPDRRPVPDPGINITEPSSYMKRNLPGRGLTNVENHWPTGFLPDCSHYFTSVL
jgi:hypothetical protein